MNFDFSALLVFLTFFSGIIWAVDAWFFAPGRKQAVEAELAIGIKEPIAVEYARSFFPIFFIVLILRSFIIEPFRIPSASMMPTLLIGDFILVNKFDYGIRLPVLNTKIFENNNPKRGDVVVFRYPEDPSIPFIKRVVGVGGDRIRYENKVIYVNNVPMEQVVKGSYSGQGAGKIMDGASWRLESLGDVEHEILMDPIRYSAGLEIVVPDDMYFVLGDNRDNSKDSRYWGFVPDDHLVGHAFMIWMNWDLKNNGIDWKRIGTMF